MDTISDDVFPLILTVLEISHHLFISSVGLRMLNDTFLGP